MGKKKLEVEENEDDNDPIKVIQTWIIILLSLSALGMIIVNFFDDINRIENEEIIGFHLVGRMLAQTGLMASAILFVKVAFMKERFDSLMRFGSLLVSGVLIAFTLMIFM
jgi:hypothetical protein